MLKKRRVEIIAFEHERIIRRPAQVVCPVCQTVTQLLTTAQAAALLQVNARSVYRWLAGGQAHGVRTPGGRHRVCRHSLCLTPSASAQSEIRTTIAARRENGR